MTEYVSIVRTAGREGWLAALVEAHARPCTIAEAQAIIRGQDLPADVKIFWRNRRGHAYFNGKTRRYSLGLPSVPGTACGRLRAGLVLHEIAHIWCHQQIGRMGHGPDYCVELREILTTNWRDSLMARDNIREIYARHRGPYALLLTRQTTDGKGRVTQSTDRIDERLKAQAAHERACKIVNDPEGNVVSVCVFSDTEGQFTGAIYTRGAEYLTWAEMADIDLNTKEPEDGRVELPDERAEAALLPEGAEPLPEVDGVVDTGVQAESVSGEGPVRNVPAKKPAAARPELSGRPRKTGLPLGVDASKAADWPKSPAAQAVLAYLQGDKRATAAAIVEALGPALNELGVAHPASLVSRLKQAGFLKEKESE